MLNYNFIILILIINGNLSVRSTYIYMLYSGNKILSSPFESSSKKKKKDIDRFIPHSVSKNLYSLF